MFFRFIFLGKSTDIVVGYATIRFKGTYIIFKMNYESARTFIILLFFKHYECFWL
jgi:hypothetical protein